MQTQRRNSPPGHEGDEVEKKKTQTAMRELDRDPLVGELRRLYDGIVDEPVPDQLLELLRKLDEVERKR